jgi:hypothetical protein
MTTDYVVRDGRRIEVETIETGIGAKTRRRQTNSFAKVPLEWAARAANATRTPQALVWVILLHMAWQAKGLPFPISNATLARYGVSREVKRRALTALEFAGLIRVERRHSRSPIVRLIDIPD